MILKIPTAGAQSLPRDAEVTRLFNNYNDAYTSEHDFTLMGKWAETLIREQERIGLDIVSDGEVFRSGSFTVFFDAFEGYLTTSNGGYFLDDGRTLSALEKRPCKLWEAEFFRGGTPTRLCSVVVDKIRPRSDMRGRIFAREADVLTRTATVKTQVTLPSPYTILRFSWNRKLSRDAYPNPEDYLEDILTHYAIIVERLDAQGVDVVAFEELCFQQVLNPKLQDFINPERECELFSEAMRCCAKLPQKSQAAIWIRNIYDRALFQIPAVKCLLDELRPLDLQWCLGGGAMEQQLSELISESSMLLLGVIKGLDLSLDSPRDMMGRIRNAESIVPLDRLIFGPDFGFSQIAQPTEDYTPIWRKLEQLVACARIVEEHGTGERAEQALIEVHERLLHQARLLK